MSEDAVAGGRIEAIAGVEASSAAAAATASAIYEGVVAHSRHAVAPHRFRYGIAMAYLDLDELPVLLGGALLDRSLVVVRFRREDYFGDPATPLATAVRDRVEQRTGVRPSGPIRLLTQLRSFGHCFNPISVYYCLGGNGSEIEALLAEVTNTPWGERHAYVLRPEAAAAHAGTAAGAPASDRSAGAALAERTADEQMQVATGHVAKALHVSPFIGMEQTYEWRASVPGDSLSLRFASRSSRDGSSPGGAPPRAHFEASLALVRRPLSKRSLAAITAKYPASSLRTLALIYLQAARIKLKGVPVQPHPQTSRLWKWAGSRTTGSSADRR